MQNWNVQTINRTISFDVVVITTAQLPSAKPELRFVMVRISGNGPTKNRV